MASKMDEEAEPRRSRFPLRRPRWSMVLLGLLLLLLLLAVVIWSQRRQLATDFVERELVSRGVSASYTITRVGLHTQRIEDVVIGDPDRPDLTAEWAEIRTDWSLSGPSITLIKARGVRMYGRIADGQLSLGEVDKLLPPKSGAPFRFPDLNVDVADAAIGLDTTYGRLAAAVEGKGNLADGFEGEIAARSTGMMAIGCALDRPSLHGKVAIRARRPSIEGPLSAARLLCEARGIDVRAPVVALDATVSEGLNAWIGEASVGAEAARIGTNALEGLRGTISFDGNDDLTRGSADLAAASIAAGGMRADRTRVEGDYALSLVDGDVSFLADASTANLRGEESLVAPVASALSAADGTPLEPLGDGLTAAVRRAAGGIDALATLRFVNGGGYSALRVDTLSASSRSGARLGLQGGTGITYYLDPGALRLDGEFALSSGGFPATRLSFAQARAGGPIEGEARIAPYAAGDAQLALAPVRFRQAGRGLTRIETRARLSGPFNGGYVQDLALPITATVGNGGFSLGEGCVTAAFRSLRISDLTLEPARLPLCPTGRALVWKDGNGPVRGGADLRSLRLAGRLGGSPIGITSERLRVALDGGTFTSSGLGVRLGAPGSVSLLDAVEMTGRFTPDGIAGRFAGLDAKIANVPLLISRGAGDWSLVDGRLAMGGSVTVADEADPPRFHPLVSNDFNLTLVGNDTDAHGLLQDPETGSDVLLATINHDLGTGRGGASLDVPGITFDPEGYQPEELTPLTIGVVALVDGRLTGRGEIAWSDATTTSTGRFTLHDMDLAAPFGPVEGLDTTIEFTDLLGLTSAPGQAAQVDAIRTGIDVFDGNIRYQLLPELKVRVEGGEWPFMGGRLVLRETVLDFSRPSTKQLTFEVVGLDAAAFVQQMEFANIEVTGIFDGVVPMEFDESGGRIVDGRLSARAPGGTLSYIGELTDKQLGTFGKMAFDALKSLSYDKLDIGLSGALDGEFLAAIELDGIARETGTQGGILGNVLNRLAKLRFEFNINIRGPFRALIGTARSFSDPSDLIQPVLPETLQGMETIVVEQDQDEQSTTEGEPEPVPIPLIQPQESEGEQ